MSWEVFTERGVSHGRIVYHVDEDYLRKRDSALLTLRGAGIRWAEIARIIGFESDAAAAVAHSRTVRYDGVRCRPWGRKRMKKVKANQND